MSNLASRFFLNSLSLLVALIFSGCTRLILLSSPEFFGEKTVNSINCGMVTLLLKTRGNQSTNAGGARWIDFSLYVTEKKEKLIGHATYLNSEDIPLTSREDIQGTKYSQFFDVPRDRKAELADGLNGKTISGWFYVNPDEISETEYERIESCLKASPGFLRTKLSSEFLIAGITYAREEDWRKSFSCDTEEGFSSRKIIVSADGSVSGSFHRNGANQAAGVYMGSIDPKGRVATLRLSNTVSTLITNDLDRCRDSHGVSFAHTYKVVVKN